MLNFPKIKRVIQDFERYQQIVKEHLEKTPTDFVNFELNEDKTMIRKRQDNALTRDAQL